MREKIKAMLLCDGTPPVISDLSNILFLDNFYTVFEHYVKAIIKVLRTDIAALNILSGLSKVHNYHRRVLIPGMQGSYQILRI